MKIERQDPDKAEVHRDLEATRARMSRTIDELDAHISERVAEVKHAVDPTTHVRAHPWPAVLTALAAGVAIGASGAERKTADAAVQGAKRVPGAAAGASKAAAHGAVDLAQTATERIAGASDDEPSDAARASGHEQSTGLFGRLRASAANAMRSEARVLGAELERAARELVDAAAARARARGSQAP